MNRAERKKASKGFPKSKQKTIIQLMKDHQPADFDYRCYQKTTVKLQDAFLRQSKKNRGCIFIGTGGGKTVIFFDGIARTILRKGNPRVLIVHPRIALSLDQQERFVRDFEEWNFPGIEFTSFHSGEVFNTRDEQVNLSTTNPEVLEERITEAQSEGRPHITFTSYKSLHKIVEADWDLIIFDEAHNLTDNQYRQNLFNIPDTSKALFFTGTPAGGATGEYRMDNDAMFGEVLHTVPPSELIYLDAIVPPKLLGLNVYTDSAGNVPEYHAIIAEAFKQQQTHPDATAVSKVLFALPGVERFDEIIKHLAVIRKTAGVNVDVYTISSQGNRINNKFYSNAQRADVLKHFAKNPNHCIILHCDTLAEGIDVSGITGVVFLRGMRNWKAIQTIGRACRRDDDAGKEVCFVTMISIDNDWIGSNVADVAIMFREAGYGELGDYVDSDNDPSQGTREVELNDDLLVKTIKDIKELEEQELLKDLFATLAEQA